MRVMLLETRSVDPNVDPTAHTNGRAILVMALCALVAIVLYWLGIHYWNQLLRRYRDRQNLPIPVGYFETLDARTAGKPEYKGEKFALMWRRQSDRDLERVRIRACVLFVTAYAVWIYAVIFVSPQMFR